MKKVLVVLLYIFMIIEIIGCGGEEVKKIQNFDSPIITKGDIDQTLSSNQTILKKSILADDGKTVINFSLDLRENNITENIPLSAKIEHFDQDGLYADLVTIDFGGKTLSNFEINIPSSKSNRSVKFSKESRDTLTSFQKSCEEMLNNQTITNEINSRASIQTVINTNICEYISDIQLIYDRENSKYKIIAKQVKKFPKYKSEELEFRIRKTVAKRAISGYIDYQYISLYTNDLPRDIVLDLNLFDKQYLIEIGSADKSGVIQFHPYLSFLVTTDQIGKDNEILMASKTLETTRANKAYDNSINSFNNFLNSQELKKPMPLHSTITHRIVDFDKVLSKKVSPNNLWNKSVYGKNPLLDNGRRPLLLIHGWQGDTGLTGYSMKKHRYPTKLLLWENSELEYWHNFLSYYLSSKELQSKYHVYLYRYTSYKHVTYNAKKLEELLFEVRTKGAMSLAPSDLEEGLNNTEKGITILAHSMGGLVSRSLIEEHNYFGENLDGLNKLITLDTPHHGSVTAENHYPQNMAKDLLTQGAADLNWDNFDGSYDDDLVNENNEIRWKADKINSKKFDEEYKGRIVDKSIKTSNPYLLYLKEQFVKNKDIHRDKYIFYTAWNVHNIIEGPLGLPNFMNMFYECGWGKIGENLGTGWTMEHKANQNFKYNFIDNNCQDISTMAMGNNPSYPKGYAAGGAAPVGSSLLSNQDYNPKVNEELEGYNQEGINIPIAMDGVPLIKVSDGADHAYGIPYRIFWDYDHTSIFSGASNGEIGIWDSYIDGHFDFQGDNSDTTFFRKHRDWYIRSAFKIRHGKELPSIFTPEEIKKEFNPLTYEPVFLVIEKDLMDSAEDENIVQNTISGQIKATNGTPIAYINVKFEYIQDGKNQEITATSDSEGKYSISINKEDFDNFKQGTKLIISAYGDGYAPTIREIEKTDQDNFYEDFVMEAIKENEIVLEIEPLLHHLGDGNYAGSANSEFQRVGAEGIEFIKTFYIDADKFSNYQRAEITYEAKGIQTYGGKLFINTTSQGLKNSPTDGSYETQKYSIDKSEYVEGDNNIKITSGKNWNGDYDDFEFINIKITFLDPLEQNIKPVISNLELEIIENNQLKMTTHYDANNGTAIDYIYWKVTSPAGEIHEHTFNTVVNHTNGSASRIMPYDTNDVFDIDGIYTVESYVINENGVRSDISRDTIYIDVPNGNIDHIMDAIFGIETPLNNKTLVENDHWRVKIIIDTLVPNKISADIAFRALNCGGELTYIQEQNGGYLFDQKITSGGCVQNCQIWIKSDGSYYEETCPNNVEGGNLVEEAGVVQDDVLIYDGLIWQDNKAVQSELMNWDEAVKYCNNLSLNDYSDWRLPNIKELENILPIKEKFQVIPRHFYWSSSIAPDNRNGLNSAWYVNFNNQGSSYYHSKEAGNYVRCVR